MDEENFFKWIFIIMIIIVIYGLLIKSSLFYDKYGEIKAVEAGIKDFCSLKLALEYYSSKNDCCFSKLSCGDNRRGNWSPYYKSCIC
jgi:hypothetical protein